MDIQRAVNHLTSLGFRLPFAVTPGLFPGGIDSEFDIIRWRDRVWNPPEELSHLPEYSQSDTEASKKFSWRQIVWADGVAELEDSRRGYLESLDSVATIKIARLYHPDAPDNRNKEWQVRLSGVDLTNEDTQRVQIVKTYRKFKTDIEAASTIVELTEIKVRIDAAGLGS